MASILKTMVGSVSRVQVTDLETVFDAAPVTTEAGLVVWATVTVRYAQDGLAPSLCLRVPVPWYDAETDAAREQRALRQARQLIDHACHDLSDSRNASSVGPAGDVVPFGFEAQRAPW